MIIFTFNQIIKLRENFLFCYKTLVFFSKLSKIEKLYKCDERIALSFLKKNKQN